MPQNQITEVDFTDSFSGTDAPIWLLDRSLSTLLWANKGGLEYWGLGSDPQTLAQDGGHILSNQLPASQLDTWQRFADTCSELTDSIVVELTVRPNDLAPERCTVQITPVHLQAQPEMLLFHILDHANDDLSATEQMALCAENTNVLIALYNSDCSLRYQNPLMMQTMALEHTSFTDLFNQPEIAKEVLNTLDIVRLAEVEQKLETKVGLRWHSLTIRSIPGIANQASSILVTANDSNRWHLAEQAAKDLALKDTLTGLPNREAMSLYLKELIKNCTPEVTGHRSHNAVQNPTQEPDQPTAQFGLFFIDLDRFKVINDSLGHSAGDSLLIEVADRLLDANRKHGKVYRLGGDEFVVVFNQQVSIEELTHNADAILEIMSTPAKVGEHTLRIRPSVGICTYPADGSTISEVLAYADAAMYLAKAEGTGYRFYDATMTKTHTETAKRRMSLESDLASAVALNQFELYYQPKISCVDLTVSGVEALLRWHHPEKGMVPPDEFIKIAEESSQIVEIGRWVLETAMQQQQLWRNQGIRVPVAINISAGQFHTGDLVNQVSKSMQATQCDPEMIELEITESMLLGDGDHIQDTLQHLSSMGIKLALDDFGTGFSNLAYLQKYPLDVLKIDRIFLADQKRSMLMGTILNMGKVLGLSVVAEGVENVTQAEWLISKGCDHLQGFYYSMPLAADDATQYLLDHGIGQVTQSRSAA